MRLETHRASNWPCSLEFLARQRLPSADPVTIDGRRIACLRGSWRCFSMCFHWGHGAHTNASKTISGDT
eukprot:9027877-Pyramimonas_sp.AAC.1